MLSLARPLSHGLAYLNLETKLLHHRSDFDLVLGCNLRLSATVTQKKF